LSVLPIDSALNTRSSFSITSSVARAATLETGFPPSVDALGRVKEAAIESVVEKAPMGVPFARALADVMMSGLTSQCWQPNIHFIGDEQDFVAVEYLLHPLEISQRRSDDSTIALDRLGEECRHAP